MNPYLYLEYDKFINQNRDPRVSFANLSKPTRQSTSINNGSYPMESNNQYSLNKYNNQKIAYRREQINYYQYVKRPVYQKNYFNNSFRGEVASNVDPILKKNLCSVTLLTIIGFIAFSGFIIAIILAFTSPSGPQIPPPQSELNHFEELGSMIYSDRKHIHNLNSL